MSTVILGPPPPRAGGATRRVLWELPADGHALLLGTCLPASELRRVTDRLFDGRSTLDDAQLLLAAAAQCTTCNRVSGALQRALDSRHAAALRRFGAARSGAELLGLWLAERDGDDFVGAFWAAIGHPHCDADLQDRLCLDLQTRLFALAARVRDDAAELAALHAELRTARAERERLQQRHADWRDLALAAREALLADIRTLRQECARLAALADRWRARAEALAAAAPDEPPRPPQERTATKPGKQPPAAGAAGRTDGEVSAALSTPPPAGPAEPAAPATAAADPPLDAAVLPRLDALAVLLVGGPPPFVPACRALVERLGGRFDHHDGGVEHSAHRLGAQLDAADLVLCQTGSVGHNAYARVKAHCKRRGTPCLYIDRPGIAAVERVLRRHGAGLPGAGFGPRPGQAEPAV